MPQQDNSAVQRALADAAALAQLQVDVLVRLNEADRAGDDEAVLRCHAELDHVMARMAEAELVRTGAQAAVPEDDLICAGCGTAARPVYETPRLLGYRCTGCGWTGDDPAAQAQRRRTEAREAAAAAVERAVQEIGDALLILDHRSKRPVRKASASCASCTRTSPQSRAGCTEPSYRSRTVIDLIRG